MSLDPFDVVTVRKSGRPTPSVGRPRQEEDDPFAVVQVQRPKALTQGQVKDVSPLKVGAPSFKQFADAGAELPAAPPPTTTPKKKYDTAFAEDILQRRATAQPAQPQPTQPPELRRLGYQPSKTPYAGDIGDGSLLAQTRRLAGTIKAEANRPVERFQQDVLNVLKTPEYIGRQALPAISGMAQPFVEGAYNLLGRPDIAEYTRQLQQKIEQTFAPQSGVEEVIGGGMRIAGAIAPYMATGALRAPVTASTLLTGIQSQAKDGSLVEFLGKGLDSDRLKRIAASNFKTPVDMALDATLGLTLGSLDNTFNAFRAPGKARAALRAQGAATQSGAGARAVDLVAGLGSSAAQFGRNVASNVSTEAKLLGSVGSKLAEQTALSGAQVSIPKRSIEPLGDLPTITQEVRSVGSDGFVVLPPQAQTNLAVEKEHLVRMNMEVEPKIQQLAAPHTRAKEGAGLFDGDVSPNALFRFSANTPDEEIRKAAAVRGLVYGQQAQLWYRPAREGDKATSAAFFVYGDGGKDLSPEAITDILAAAKENGIFGATKDGGTLSFLNIKEYTELSDDVFNEKMGAALQAAKNKHSGIIIHQNNIYSEFLNGTSSYIRAIGPTSESLLGARNALVEATPEYLRYAKAVGADPAVTQQRITARLAEIDEEITLQRAIETGDKASIQQSLDQRLAKDIGSRVEAQAPTVAPAVVAPVAPVKAELPPQAARRTGNIPSGLANPALVQGLGGFAAGATAGVATDDEGGMSPLQRALLYGAAGAAGGVGVGRAMRGRGGAAVASSVDDELELALSPILRTINTGKRAGAGESPSMLTLMQRVYSKLVSEIYPLEEAARRFGTPEQGKELPGLIAQKQGSGRAAQGYLYDNLSPLLRTLSKKEKGFVRALLKGRRDLQIRGAGGAAKSAVPLDELERGVLAGNANPKIAAAADRVTAMHRELLEMRYKAGLLTDEAYDAIIKSDDFYTPLITETIKDAGPVRTTPGARGGKLNVSSSGVSRMDRAIEMFEQTADPLEMIVSDAAKTYRDVSKQRVSNVIFSIADDNKMIGSDGLPLIERIQADPMSPPKGPDIIQQVRNGKLYTYRVNDKDILAALTGLDAVSSNAFIKFASLLKNIKTAGIVVLPDFSAANVTRDVPMAGVQRTDYSRAVREGAIGALSGGTFGAATADSEENAIKRFILGAGLGVGAGLYARPFGQTMVAVKQILGNDKIYREFLANGGSTEGFVVRNANDAAKILKNLEKGPGFSPSDFIIPTNWWETLRKIGSVGEQATRVAAFEQGIKSGMSGAEAALLAQDRTLRFANVGGSKTVKDFAAITPFWNAKVQGWAKLGRMLKDPKTSGLAAGMLFAPTVALWMVNKDYPEYWARPVWERNLFWLIPKSAILGEGARDPETGETGFFKIPKPFELGFLFASMPERALDYATQAGLDLPFFGEIQSASPQVAEPKKLLARSAADIGAASFEGTLPIPEVVSLPTQLFMNKDLFRNRPIVSRPQLSPELQVTEESSAVARALAKAGVSPEKTDFFIRNAFGTAGAEMSKVLDIGARAAGISAPEASAGTSRIPFLGRFSERFTTNNKGQTDPESIARDRLRELTQIESDYNELVRRGDYGKLVDFAEKNMDDLELAKKIQPLETELDKLSRLRTQIRRDGSFSAEDRRVALGILRERGQAISEVLIGVPKR